ncbi:restriction endonuclease subunit S [uncultured Veillonella sp.]|uniref:restriction endonuclease subunit S n=1 Tax=uncultured Veillonella sp. TaxID=159268 RepID=UPI00259BDF3D|nr:restriction endonuclease subunit S [uncultured Veillonella sp.]
MSWEQRKLGACFEERCENMPDGELISVTISDGIKKFSELGRHDNSNQDKSKYKKVCIGDIAYNSMRMWQGASGYSPFEGIVSPAYTVLKPNVNINSKCVSYLFKRQDMIHVFQLNSQGITSDNWNLKFPALSQIAVSLPGDIKEQSRIATYFSNIDTLITLHQRKLNILKSVPKFLLGIVWEQRKLGDIVTRVIRKNENLESKLPLTISAQFGLIAQDEFFDKRIASKNISHYYLIRKGEFAYNKSTSMDAPWGAIKRLEHYDNGVLSTLYIMFRILDENKVNSDYIVSYYVTNLWHKGVREVAAEGARNHGLLNIAPVDFFETTLTIPSNENEQKNIGEYFRRLDRLITLHQRQQNLWKFVRKGVKLWIILTKNQILKRP